ncbi:hypothetical protein BOO69_09650 [Sulfitobacter alexandrii]|uniref:Uncharacterized protein n=1 Tax=Sulfitobacter alexandrii TaxID=1917485 RepID=A0A1J0WH60_9RHOB|nr:phage protease [Sulfitobacter alexandrii]APE43649.1 hypothetical protein BOO69_09650 [Sulfitobacter alexandrii]
MTTKRTFTCTAEILPLTGEALPGRIELMPLGPIRLQDRRGEVGRVTDAAGLIARTMAAAKGGMLPIDFAHGMDGQGNRDGRAAGWITSLEVSGQRIVASVEWTPAGEEALRGRHFRFISPTFTVPEGQSEVGRILRAGLTNDPALPELALVASQQENDLMPQWLKQLAAKLGMPEETDEAKVLAAAESAIDQAEHAAGIVTAAGLTGELTETAATAIAAKITAAPEGGADPDPSKFVPMSAFQELSAKFTTLTASVNEDRAGAVVTAAMEAGKVTPGLEDWARKYAASDLAGFKTWLASAPVVVDGKSVTPKGAPENADHLTADERAVIAATGVSEEAFLAQKQGKPLVPAKKDA